MISYLKPTKNAFCYSIKILYEIKNKTMVKKNGLNLEIIYYVL